MPNSMTGFAAADVIVEPFHLSWELRSVNHRFLDLGFRLPEELRSLEPALRERATGVLSRGKVDCTLKVSLVGQAAAGLQLNREVLGTLRRVQSELLAEWPDARPFAVAELLRWPGVLEEPSQRMAALGEPAAASFAEALDGLAAARRREGARLGDVLKQRLDAIAALLEGARPELAAHAPRYREKLLERLDRLDLKAEPERLEQELAFIAQRLDIAEEADRLAGHLAEISDILERAEPIGRRLDFLIQELNREVNTIASKAQDEALARRAVDLKVLVEQMREQVQNLE